MSDPINSNTPADQTSSYYCHSCSRTFTEITSEFTCPSCHSGFVELNENDSNQSGAMNTDHIHGPVSYDFDNIGSLSNFATQFLNMAQQQQQQQPTTSTSVPSGTTPQPSQNPTPNPLSGFLQNLLQSLTNDGAFQFQFQINDANGQSAFAFPRLHGNTGDYAWGAGGLDAIVTQLLNQVEGGTPALSPDKIETLPQVVITKEQVEKRMQCAVCMDDFKLAENVCKIACDHIFHKNCIVPWLQRHNSCPVCRKNAETGLAPEAHQVHPQPVTEPVPGIQRNVWRDIDELD